MRLLIYNSFSNGPESLLERSIGALIPKEKVRIHRTIDDLHRGLSQPGEAPTIAILQATDQQDLQYFLSVRDRLGDARLILILPDMEETTVAKAHRLRPRVLVAHHGDYSEVLAVLGKMLGRAGPLGPEGR